MRVYPFILAIVMLLGSMPAMASAIVPVSGAWRAVRPGDTPAGVLDQANRGKLQTFDTTRLQTFPHDDLGAWVVLWPRDPDAHGAYILSIPSPPFGTVTLYDRQGPLDATSLTAQAPHVPGYGRLAFRLPASPLGLQPILLKFEPSASLAAPVKFELMRPAAFERSNSLWLSMASASLAVMLAMALMALCFSIMLGDSTFAWYAAYVTSYAGIQAIQTGYLFHPLRLHALAPVALQAGATLTAISVVAAVMFLIRFCSLRRHAPWLRALLLSMAGMLVLLLLLQVLGLPGLLSLVHTLFNPLLALSAGLMVLASSVALVRGSRSALFFLFGWLPLLVLTALTSLQVGGAFAGVDWLNDASLMAGAIEALVLAVGLADRSLTMRRDHVLARELANKDPLTGVLNRRAWIEATQQRLGVSRQTQTLLFMDLDHFKTLNDELGHGAGDKALVAMAESFATELRPQDLLGRFGGEEFVALLSGTDKTDARLVAQRLCRRLHRLEIPMNRAGEVLTISIGLATRRPEDTLSSLVERADAAMYAAKARGRNRVVDEDETDAVVPAVLRPSRSISDLQDRNAPRSGLEQA